jgi:hypothetical protein
VHYKKACITVKDLELLWKQQHKQLGDQLLINLGDTMNNVFASLMIAGLIVGSVARAEEHATAPAAKEMPKAEAGKEGCKSGKMDKDGCGAKMKKGHKKMMKKGKADAAKEMPKAEAPKAEEAHH